MFLGKRTRPTMRKTTSVTEFTLDLGILEAPIPSYQHTQVAIEGTPARKNTGVLESEEFDHRFLSTVSPTNHRRNSGDFIETAHFLRACGLCKRRLAPGRDIYMYRGDTAFCSSECRQKQMNQDERKEKCSLASTVGSEASNSGEKVVAA